MQQSLYILKSLKYSRKMFFKLSENEPIQNILGILQGYVYGGI